MLCARFGIESEPDPNHAAYIDGWLGDLAADGHAFHNAASAGQKGARFLDTRTRAAEVTIEHANDNQVKQEQASGRAA